MKKILICFDGTGNAPDDAVQNVSRTDEVDDNNISNVLKLHLRAGGRLEQRDAADGQISLYYPGPGTRGGLVRRAVTSGMARSALEKIKNEALQDVARIYEPGDEIAVFGFSRGAAIARRFVARLQHAGAMADDKGVAAGEPVPVKFVGVWDTVLSEGAPWLKPDLRPTAAVHEHDGIGESVERVNHLVSLDDPRLAFTPTLFAPDPQGRVNEVWFAGVHSDVGGGYRQSGLSDLALEYMLERASDEAGLTFRDPQDVDLDAATGGRVQIDADDIASAPDVKAESHIGNFDKFYKEMANAIGRRQILTLSGDPPLIHDSVVKRGHALKTYRPANLAEVPHRVVGGGAVHQRFAEHFTST